MNGWLLCRLGLHRWIPTRLTLHGEVVVVGRICSRPWHARKVGLL